MWTGCEDHKHDPSNGLRGMKRDGWEGGHRVPFIFRWPGRIPAGQVSTQLANTTDIMATLASLTGYTLPDKAATDSFDLLPVLLGKQKDDNPVRPHLLTQGFRGEFQLRVGDWKYLDHKGSGGNSYERSFLKKYVVRKTRPRLPVSSMIFPKIPEKPVICISRRKRSGRKCRLF